MKERDDEPFRHLSLYNLHHVSRQPDIFPHTFFLIYRIMRDQQAFLSNATLPSDDFGSRKSTHLALVSSCSMTTEKYATESLHSLDTSLQRI